MAPIWYLYLFRLLCPICVFHYLPLRIREKERECKLREKGSNEIKLNGKKKTGMDSLERSRGVGAVITTYHLRAPGSSHHQVVSHSIVQRFTDEATAHILYTHTALTHLHTHTHTDIHKHDGKLPAVDSTDR